MQLTLEFRGFQGYQDRHDGRPPIPTGARAASDRLQEYVDRTAQEGQRKVDEGKDAARDATRRAEESGEFSFCYFLLGCHTRNQDLLVGASLSVCVGMFDADNSKLSALPLLLCCHLYSAHSQMVLIGWVLFLHFLVLPLPEAISVLLLSLSKTSKTL